MNSIAVIIFIALLAEFFLELIADVLNLSRIQKKIPDAFNNFYDPERYKTLQDYLKTCTRFGWVYGSASLALLLCFWFFKGFPVLDAWVRSFSMGPVVSGILFIGSLAFLKGIFSVPFNIYDTFVIEARYGFNRTTWKTFVMDRVKGIFLAVVLGVPLLAGILTFFEYAGNHAWWLCWLVTVVYMMVVQFIAPTWIMPLFNKFVPLEEGSLKDAIFRYAEKISFPLKKVMVMDGSKRSGKSNAFFTGFGKNKRIVLFDTLIEKHPQRELITILAHEMGHYKKKHILKGLAIGIVQTGIMFFLLSLFIHYQGMFDAFYMSTPSVYGGIIFFGILFGPMDLVLSLFIQANSRKNEKEADRFAVTTTNDPKAMIDALKRLSVDNLSNLTPHPFYVFLHYSHPPVLKRILAIEQYS